MFAFRLLSMKSLTPSPGKEDLANSTGDGNGHRFLPYRTRARGSGDLRTKVGLLVVFKAYCCRIPSFFSFFSYGFDSREHNVTTTRRASKKFLGARTKNKI